MNRKNSLKKLNDFYRKTLVFQKMIFQENKCLILLFIKKQTKLIINI